ncbi:MAG TPA: hypothetical protein VG228_02250 [Solirubrobacteraceae bacterium]|jgi:hypothetical protein|nr:hypothetical protein [Solirubrobacteraceae bacterium]
MATADGVLDASEVEVRGWVESLRGELVRVGEQLAQAENALSRMEITRATLAEVVGRAGEGPVAQVLAALRAREGSPPLTPVEAAGVAELLASSIVPVWRADLTAAHLPAGYRQLWELVRDARTPPRVRELTSAAGLEDTAAKREGVRSKLKRLVARGWMREDAPGCFSVLTCPAGGS